LPRTDLGKKADMKNIFLTLFLTIGLTSAGQNYIDYYNLANEAEYKIIDGGNLKEAKKTLVALDKKYGRLLFKDNFYLGVLYYLDNDSINGFKYFSKYINDYGSPCYELPKFKKCFPQLKISDKAVSDLKFLENKITLVFKDTVYFNKVIKSVNDSINYYVNMDQKNRENPDKIDQQLDDLIQLRYLNYLKSFGIPKTGMFGEDFTIILDHVTDKQLNKMYRDYFMSEIIKGNVCPYTYAILVDKSLIAINETFYGAFYIKSSHKLSKEEIISNRKKIGLSQFYDGPNNYPWCKKAKQ
jgi:hypothetical protein